MTHHPIRDAALHVFERTDDAAQGPRFMARFYPYSIYPVFFTGPTKDAAIASAEELRAEAIAKHEAAYILKQEAKAKAKAARDAKKEAAQ